MGDRETLFSAEGGTLPVGWGFPGNSRRCHFFNADSTSLCRRWGFFFGRTQPDTGKTGPDDCAACTKAMVKIGLREPS